MRWHAEFLIEGLLLATLVWKKPGLRWWESLIGVDFIANMMQLIPYRSGFLAHSRLIWIAGILMTLPVSALALVEAAELESGAFKYRHVRILSLWLMLRLMLISLQTQRDLVVPTNHLLLGVDSCAFLGWIMVLV